VSGFHKPTAGRILLDGKDVTGLPAHEIARLGMARTFQTTHLFTEATVLENVLVGHRLRTTSNLWDALFRTPRLRREEKKCRDRAMECLSFVGLEHLADMPVSSISQEAQKRVAIALALATDPQIVLLDEPAGGINPEETAELTALIRKMVEHGLTVCLIEHKMQMVMDLADTIMVLHHGSKIAQGTPEEISRNEEVIEAYLGRRDVAGNS
jgi:branched-chain amino acid transport system ATP-binding protein